MSDRVDTLFSPNIVPEREHVTPVPIAILASGNGSNFEAIAEAVDAGDVPADIRLVIYNNEDAFVATRARHRDIPAVYVDHRNYSERDTFERRIVSELRDRDIEWVVMAGWMRVATRTLIGEFPDRIVNIHPSLLPSFRGLNAVEQALAAGVKITGCTVHLVRIEVDDGPVVAQAAIRVHPDDDSETLHRRIHQAEHTLYPRALAMLLGYDSSRR